MDLNRGKAAKYVPRVHNFSRRLVLFNVLPTCENMNTQYTTYYMKTM